MHLESSTVQQIARRTDQGRDGGLICPAGQNPRQRGGPPAHVGPELGMIGLVEQETAARAARAQIEQALDALGWPWSWRLSLWVAALVIVEESGVGG